MVILRVLFRPEAPRYLNLLTEAHPSTLYSHRNLVCLRLIGLNVVVGRGRSEDNSQMIVSSSITRVEIYS